MPRRRRRDPMPVTLALPAEPPEPDEIDVILMAADGIVGQAGRSGLVLILNGSRSQKVYEWGWEELPDYGALRHLTAKTIGPKVDWCIHHGWLGLEYRDGVPLLVHTAKGWKRVVRIWVDRLLAQFEAWQAAGTPERVWPRMEIIHREIKFLLLDTIEAQERADLAPVLRAWFPHEVRKVRQRINQTLQQLGEPALSHPR